LGFSEAGTQWCFSNPPCAARLNARTATVVSTRIAETAQLHSRQCQPLKCSFSIHAIRSFIVKPISWILNSGGTHVRGKKRKRDTSWSEPELEILPTTPCRTQCRMINRQGQVTKVCRPLQRNTSYRHRDSLQVFFVRFNCDKEPLSSQ